MYVGRTVGIDSKAVFIFIFFVASFEINPGFSFFEAFFSCIRLSGIKYQSLPAAVRYIVCHSEVGQVRKDGVIPDFDGVVGCSGRGCDRFMGCIMIYVDLYVIAFIASLTLRSVCAFFSLRLCAVADCMASIPDKHNRINLAVFIVVWF